MSDNENPPVGGETPEAAEQLEPYVIEAARSSRSRCKTCRRKIDQGSVRIGIRVEGFYGAGYMWHHLGCAARRQMDKVEEAYSLESWKNAKAAPPKLPSLDELRALREKAEEKKKQQKELPYVEEDPSGRAKCSQCGEPIEKGSLRIALGKEVSFGQQTRTSAIKVHPRCLDSALDQPDVVTERDGLREALLDNSELDPERIDEALAAMPADGGAEMDPGMDADRDAPEPGEE